MHARERMVSHAEASPRADVRALDDAELVRATLAKEQAAWRELMRRYAGVLLAAAHDIDAGLSDADADDVVANLWLSLIERDMHQLRAFDPSRGAALLSWLTIRLYQLIYERQRRREAEPQTVPLVEATKIPAAQPLSRAGLEDRPLMTVDEVARRWGLDRKTVYAMIDRGQISARRCGRLVRIPRKMVESFESQACVSPGRHIKCR